MSHSEFHVEITGAIKVFANSPQEAVMKTQNALISVTSVDMVPYIGQCELSNTPIFEGDDYQEDAEGIVWLSAMECKQG